MSKRKERDKERIEAFVNWKGKVIKFSISSKAYTLCDCIRRRYGVPLHELYEGACKITNGKPTEESLLKYLDIRYSI